MDLAVKGAPGAAAPGPPRAIARMARGRVPPPARLRLGGAPVPAARAGGLRPSSGLCGGAPGGLAPPFLRSPRGLLRRGPCPCAAPLRRGAPAPCAPPGRPPRSSARGSCGLAPSSPARSGAWGLRSPSLLSGLAALPPRCGSGSRLRPWPLAGPPRPLLRRGAPAPGACPLRPCGLRGLLGPAPGAPARAPCALALRRGFLRRGFAGGSRRPRAPVGVPLRPPAPPPPLGAPGGARPSGAVDILSNVNRPLAGSVRPSRRGPCPCGSRGGSASDALPGRGGARLTRGWGPLARYTVRVTSRSACGKLSPQGRSTVRDEWRARSGRVDGLGPPMRVGGPLCCPLTFCLIHAILLSDKSALLDSVPPCPVPLPPARGFPLPPSVHFSIFLVHKR